MGLERSGPATIEGRALVEPIKGGFTAASQYEVTYTYSNGVTHVCKSTTINGPAGQVNRQPMPGEFPNGVKFEGTDGWIFVTRGRLQASDPQLLKQELPASAERLYVSNDHMGNFFECARSRKPTICEPAIGHRSVSVCHLGVIAIRTGRKLKWDPAKEQFEGDSEANQHIAREMRKPWSYDAV
jgi:hypothetical protein